MEISLIQISVAISVVALILFIGLLFSKRLQNYIRTNHPYLMDHYEDVIIVVALNLLPAVNLATPVLAVFAFIVDKVFKRVFEIKYYAKKKQ